MSPLGKALLENCDNNFCVNYFKIGRMFPTVTQKAIMSLAYDLGIELKWT